LSRIVAVHGIAQQYKGPSILHQEWFAPLCDGISLAGGTPPAPEDLVCTFYAELFRPKGLMPSEQLYDADSITDPFEEDLLNAWCLAAAKAEPDKVVPPDRFVTGHTSWFVQRALEALSHSSFFAGLAEKALIFNLKQVSAYFQDDGFRRMALEHVEKVVTDDTRVLIGHSLGSVVAYECLCAHHDWPVTTLITLGSPLGIRNLIFDRLQPAPVVGLGVWPGMTVKQWFNIADDGDIVALVKDLRPVFGPYVENFLVHNGAKAHSISPYLTARETGRAIISGLG
jgi:hypothetical protein